MTDLPRGWMEAEIGELCDLKNGRAFKPRDWTDYGKKIVRIQNLNNPEAQYNHFDGDVRDRFIIQTDDLLFAWSGTPGTSFGAHIWRGGEAVLNQHIFRVDFDRSLLDLKFFKFAINETLDELIAKAHGGVGLRHVTKSKFEETPIPVPPFHEQRRIVEKIEAMFDEIDKGVQSLQTARATLGLYRQSLLKSAFEGRLTADWRAQNADKLEAPDTLLARIQSERDTRYKAALDTWQDALAKWRADGEKGKKPVKPKRLTDIDPAKVSVTDEGWADLPLGELIGEVQQGWSPKCDDGRPIGPDDWTVVTTTAVQHCKYSDKEIKLLPARFEPRPEIEIESGDFLMTRKGPRGRTGVVCLVPKTRHRIMLCDTVYRFRCDETAILPRLLEFALNSPLTLREIDALKSGISDSGISLNHGKIKSVSVKFPLSKAEQAEIVRHLDARLEAADALEAEIDAALTRADALRQSILKKAFSGQLVPQDPNDEPASALLDRIKAERVKAPKKTRKKAPA